MTSKQRDEYARQLRALAARIGGTVAGLEEQVRTPTGGEAAGGMSNAPLHLGDIGTEAYNQELGAALLENEAYLRDEVAAALDRVGTGTFGRCENCGSDVPDERLDALPYTRYCAPCSAALQAGRPVSLNDGRPPTWLGEPGHEGLDQAGSPGRVVGRDLGGGPDDVHAVGTPGGGTAVGGLAGTNIGTGRPDEANLERAMADGTYDQEVEAAEADEETGAQAYSGPAGGAVGGTPANKRARGGKTTPKPRAEPAKGKAKPTGGKKSPPKKKGKEGG